MEGIERHASARGRVLSLQLSEIIADGRLPEKRPLAQSGTSARRLSVGCSTAAFVVKGPWSCCADRTNRSSGQQAALHQQGPTQAGWPGARNWKHTSL
jgi:hypothetical protein